MARYSVLEPSDVAQLEEIYGFELGPLIPLDGGMATSSFTAECASGKLVVSILDNQDQAAALRLAQVTEHMWRHDVPTCQVMRRPDGSLLGTVRGKSVLVKKFIPGQTRTQIPDELLPTAAELLGRIHQTELAGLDIPVGLRRLSPALRQIIDDFPNLDHARWLRNRLKRLDHFFPPDEDPRRAQWRLIHGDFTPSNIIVSETEDKMWAIDWETVTIDDPMLDCGMSVMNMCVVDNHLSQRRLSLFAEGYRRSGCLFEEDRIRPSVEYAAVIVAFHRYRRHNIRFPSLERKDYYRRMVDFVEREFPGADE
jgi:Ser/Thr protein kinase RdoA (MazF antagonist)